MMHQTQIRNFIDSKLFLKALNKTTSLLSDGGATFSNAFVNTPVCCPSRSSMLTGQYLHNLPITNNSVSGGCASQEWQDGPEQNTFATYLKSQVKLDSGIEIGKEIQNKFRFLTSGVHNILRRQVLKSVWCGTVTRWHWACPTRMG